MTATPLDGKATAATIRREVAARASKLADAHGITPGLAAVLVGDDPASEVYVRMKTQDAKEVGLTSTTVRLPATTPETEILARVRELNEDPTWHGILVQLPLPDHVEETTVLASVDPAKDVDGFHPANQGRLLEGNPRFVPATPRGVVELLLRAGHDPEGQHVVIVGRSNIVGKPLAALLMRKGPGGNATVTVCHSRTRDLASHTRAADILVVAAGRPGMITADHVREGAVVVDVGINRVEADTEKGYRLVGDVAFDEVREVAGAITPVPGGVGPMTRAMLLVNTVDAAEAIAGLDDA